MSCQPSGRRGGPCRARGRRGWRSTGLQDGLAGRCLLGGTMVPWLGCLLGDWTVCWMVGWWDCLLADKMVCVDLRPPGCGRAPWPGRRCTGCLLPGGQEERQGRKGGLQRKAQEGRGEGREEGRAHGIHSRKAHPPLEAIAPLYLTVERGAVLHPPLGRGGWSNCGG